MRALLIPLVLLVVIGRDAFGQLIPSAPITTQECSRQASAIGPSDRTALGWSRLPDCGTTGGTALANALSAARSSADSIYLYSLLVVASRIQNPTLLLTAQTVAEDRSAADPPPHHCDPDRSRADRQSQHIVDRPDVGSNSQATVGLVVSPHARPRRAVRVHDCPAIECGSPTGHPARRHHFRDASKFARGHRRREVCTRCTGGRRRRTQWTRRRLPSPTCAATSSGYPTLHPSGSTCATPSRIRTRRATSKSGRTRRNSSRSMSRTPCCWSTSVRRSGRRQMAGRPALRDPLAANRQA